MPLQRLRFGACIVGSGGHAVSEIIQYYKHFSLEIASPGQEICALAGKVILISSRLGPPAALASLAGRLRGRTAYSLNPLLGPCRLSLPYAVWPFAGLALTCCGLRIVRQKPSRIEGLLGSFGSDIGSCAAGYPSVRGANSGAGIAKSSGPRKGAVSGGVCISADREGLGSKSA